MTSSIIAAFMCLISLLASPAFNQEPGSVAAPAGSQFKHKSRIVSRYDSAQDKTTVFVEPYIIKQTTSYVRVGAASTAFTAGFTHAGKAMQSAPQVVEFGIISESTTGYFYEKKRRLLITLDGETLDIGDMTLVNSRFYKFNGSKWREDLAINLPFETFLKLTRAKKADLKVGSEKFSLREEHLEALRELASRART